MKKLLQFTVGVAIVTTILEFPSAASAQNFTQIYVFGDSLSDTGNAFKATQGRSPISPPYFKGRYSNGPLWIEYLASRLKVTFNSDTNFAYGGARTDNSRELPPGLLTQIDRFKAINSSANPKALYIVWMGANDYLGGATETTTPVNNITNAVNSLSTAGARNIVVFNLPDLGRLPGTRTTARSQPLNALTKEHNSKLATSVNNLRQQLGSELNLTYFDVNDRFHQVIDNPDKYGLKNVTQACLNQGNICDNPNEYLFWDEIHPTTRTHILLAQFIFSTLQPEAKSISAFDAIVPLILPAVMLVILGALCIGFALKYKKARINR